MRELRWTAITLPQTHNRTQTANSHTNHLFRHLFVDITIRNKRHIRLCYS